MQSPRARLVAIAGALGVFVLLAIVIWALAARSTAREANLVATLEAQNTSVAVALTQISVGDANENGSGIVACVTVESLTVRAEPGLEYSGVGELHAGDCARLDSRSEDAAWVRLNTGEWATSLSFDIQGDLSQLPVVQVKETSPSVETEQSAESARECPDGCKIHYEGCDIKGNISFSSGEKIYHLEGGEFYDQTIISPSKGERWFCTEAEAEANGWRPSSH